MGYYLHHTPGRLRVKLPGLQHKPHRCRSLEERFSARKGIHGVCIRPLTGSLTVQYDPDQVPLETIIGLLKTHCGFDDSQLINNDELIRNTATRATQALGRALFGWGVGRALEANGLSLLAALI